jgi:hypothetical protein
MPRAGLAIETWSSHGCVTPLLFRQNVMDRERTTYGSGNENAWFRAPKSKGRLILSDLKKEGIQSGRSFRIVSDNFHCS